MKKKRNNVVVLAIIGLLGIGYLIPTAIMKLEDMGLWSEKKSIEIEEIQLNSQEVDVIEELEVFPEMLSNNIVVGMGDGVEEEYAGAMQQAEDSEEQSVLETLYHTTQDFLTMLDVKEELRLEKFSAINYAMMVDKDDERVYSIWSCVGYDKGGNAYYFWMDATTKKVMAFDVPYSTIGNSDEAFYSAMDRIIDYYDFSAYGFPVYSFSETPSMLYYNKYWSNDLLILNKEGEEKLSICVYKMGDRLLFNTYSGTTSIFYDAE